VSIDGGSRPVVETVPTARYGTNGAIRYIVPSPNDERVEEFPLSDPTRRGGK
jgi:hypothetical protein